MMFSDEVGLAKLLKIHFREVKVPPGKMEAGDVVVRPGHCGMATGVGDTVTQYGSPPGNIPLNNRVDTINKAILKRTAPGGKPTPSASEKKELVDLQQKIDKANPKGTFSTNDVSLSTMMANRTDHAKVFRRIKHTTGKCVCGQTHPNHAGLSFRPGPGECCWCGIIHWYAGH